MTIMHHPGDETLAAFAAGTLDEARAVVVATHLSLCPQCRGTMRAFELAGGAMLEAANSAAMSADALQRALARLGESPPVIPDDLPVRAGADGDLPAPLSHYALGPWRWIGRGVQWRTVDVASDDAVRVFMLKAAPGTKLPRHKHTGTEWTCVFEGAFRHDLGRYGPGDFDEADDTVEHDPMVEDGLPCICLVAMQGTIKLQGALGRLIQPFLRI